MIGIDSNVLVRLITRDDAEQTQAAQRIVRQAGDSELFVGLVVLAEVAWVLRRAYRYDEALVLNALERVLDGREFEVERSALARVALANARAAGCGYAEALIDAMATAAGVAATLTFDTRARRLPTMRDATEYQLRAHGR